MKSVYPIVMTQGKNFVLVFVPDFDINTQERTFRTQSRWHGTRSGLWELTCRTTAKRCRKRRALRTFKRTRLPEALFCWLTLTLRNTAGK